jgi:hypothetical protein
MSRSSLTPSPQEREPCVSRGFVRGERRIRTGDCAETSPSRRESRFPPCPRSQWWLPLRSVLIRPSSRSRRGGPTSVRAASRSRLNAFSPAVIFPPAPALYQRRPGEAPPPSRARLKRARAPRAPRHSVERPRSLSRYGSSGDHAVVPRPTVPPETVSGLRHHCPRWLPLPVQTGPTRFFVSGSPL